MERITAITAQKNNKKRANIFIDGEFRCSLDKMAILTFSLKEGDEIDTQRLSDIIKDSEEKSAFDLAIKYLSLRMRTEQETKKYLLGKRFTQEVIDNTLKKLKEYKYVDDERFCRAYIKTYNQKFGSKKIAYELSRLGVNDKLISLAFDEDEIDEQCAAEAAAEKYIRTHSKVNYNKLATFLYGRGFDGETSRKTAQKFMQKHSDASIDGEI